MQRRVLAIAYHYPPIQGSSGVHRTLAFSRYLPEFDWDVTVLSAHLRAYKNQRAENLDLIPPHVRVVRAQAWDTVRHLSIGGQYPRFLALPDRWQTWIAGGVLAGLRAIRRDGVSAIFSTYPIASAHAIALVLHRLTGLPWIADFRDPMYQENYPPEPLVRRSYRWLEAQVFRHARTILVTTPGTADYYVRRYGPATRARIRVVPNGYDPEAFPADLPPPPARLPAVGDRPLVLLHSGILYPMERDPEPFLRALASWLASQPPGADAVRVVFRGSVHGATFQPLVDRLGLGGIVSFPPALSYREALQEMLGADALLVFQADNCNSQIPAKVYEYLYTGKPVIGITDPAGDTGRLLLDTGVGTVAKLENEADIRRLLASSIPMLRAGSFPLPDRAAVLALSRHGRTAELAAALDEACSPPAAAPRVPAPARAP
ncbi:MAG: glycosyltransferase [Gammaproteobacteria bacterium]|nr:glycosyltransferase [Gammaproteobacteria bacterium]